MDEKELDVTAEPDCTATHLDGWKENGCNAKRGATEPPGFMKRKWMKRRTHQLDGSNAEPTTWMDETKNHHLDE